MKNVERARVAVLGAGFAGLSAARSLVEQGHQVTILEVQDRVGGRAFSVQENLSDGLVAEAGPSRYPPSLKRVFSLAREFGLEIDPFYPEWGTVVGYFEGRRIERYEPNSQEFWGYMSIRNRYPGRIEGSLLRAALRVRRYLQRVRGKAPWTTYRITGGTHRLAQALADACGAEIRLSSQVTAIKQDKECVTVEVNSAGIKEFVESDFVVCAVPLSMLNTMDFTPPIDQKRRDIAAAVPFSSAIRIFVQMSRPYWRDNGHNGFAVTDTIGEVWDPHFDESDGPAMLVCYAKDELAVELGSLGEDERISRAVSELDKIFPGAHENYETGASFFWNEQPWIMGGWPHARLKYAGDMAAFRKPHDRVYFAGDYATKPLHLNNTEGAVESGQYAASLICEKVANR